MQLERDRARLHQLQAAAAIGQIRLTNGWLAAFAAHGLTGAQVLLTSEDTEDRRRFLNAFDTLSTLLASGIVPVVNENDTVATDEIRFGDNDRLAARVAQMLNADALVLFSDVDGLYDGTPGASGATLVERVDEITPAIEGLAIGSRSPDGSGGMQSKLEAARIARASGADMFICNGRIQHPLMALRDGAPHTRFVAGSPPADARRRWIGATLKPRGVVTIDAGAAAALADGRSLLPIGVTAVEGSFDRGDPVSIVAPDRREVARGLSAYDSEEARRIAGRQSTEIAAILGYRGRTVLVHRNDLVARSLPAADVEAR